MKKLIFSLAIAFTLLTFSQMVSLQTDLPTFQTYALLVGVSDYEHHTDLVNPVIDVKTIEEELREVYKCKTKMLLNPTKRQFLKELHQQAKRKYGPNDQLLVLFSGHGWFDETIKRGYLALKDSKLLNDDPLYESYVSHEDVRVILERLDCKHVLLMVDSCFSGTLDPTIAMANRGKATTDPYASLPRAEYIKRKLRYKTRRYITAGGKEFVPDGRPGQHSPFARKILESLRNFGGNDAILTLEEMMIELEKTTPEPRAGELLGNEPGSSFVLMANPVESPPKSKPKQGELILVTTPANAKVTLKPLGNLQRDIKLKPTENRSYIEPVGNRYRLPVGRYRVSASLTGYKTATQDVDIGEGEKTIRLKLSEGGAGEIIGKDGAPMVLIPAGEFSMGDHHGDVDWVKEKATPVHTVYLDAFYMDKYEVTNAQFKKFLQAKPQWQKDKIDSKYHNGDYLKDWDHTNYPSGKADHPAIWVSWYAAAAYAQWAGKKLPTEAQWEKAARGGLVGKIYPRGDTISHDDANYSGTGGRDKWHGTAPVGSFPANGYGLFDMAGNVWEWCADEYDSGYYGKSPKNNPTGPGTPARFVDNDFSNVKNPRVLRGGSWGSRYLDYLRCTYRCAGGPAPSSDDYGFRCSSR